MKRMLVLAFAAVPAFALAQQEVYTIDPDHTIPAFEVKHFGMSTQRGLFTKANGKVALDRTAKKGNADVRIDMTAVTTAVPKLADHLRSEDFFDAAKYPTAIFKGSDFKFDGDKLVAVGGELTLHGVTRPVTLSVAEFNCGNHPLTKKAMCGADLSATIKRSDFGVKAYVPAVGDDVKLSISVEAYRD